METNDVSYITFDLPELDLLVATALHEVKRGNVRQSEFLALDESDDSPLDWVQARQERWAVLLDKFYHWRESLRRAGVWNAEEDKNGN